MECKKPNYSSQIDFDLELPAGMSIKLNGDVTDVLRIIDLALLPFKPVFLLVDVFSKLKDVIVNIPLVLTDLTKFLEYVTAFTNVLLKLSGFIPALAIPSLIVNVIKLIKIVLQALLNDLKSLVEWDIKVKGMDMSFFDEETKDCLNSLSSNSISNYLSQLGVINSIIETLQNLANIIGLDLTTLGLSGTLGIDGLAEDFSEIINILEDFIGALP